MKKSLDEVIDSILANVYPLFEEHPELKKLLRDMSLAVCADSGSISPEQELFPSLLAQKGIGLFEANFNAILGQVQSLDPAFKIACGAGCSYCCSSHITVTPQEGFHIGLHLAATRSADEFTELAEQCLAIAAGLESATLEEYAKNYFQPCPFLKADKCSIYEVRPVLARNWISTDVEACRKSFDSKNKISVPQNSLIMVQKDLIYAGQAAYLAGFNIDGNICSFMPLMAQIMTDFEGTYAKWLSGEKLAGQM
ncbi:YkgJ family cysteine cluster protein [Desulfovibrio sp. JC010]|uniref:YkgJ family cysteine cluster protein n=1 Tax=Desulfovibrio sp. JC010 TaxID=2593641 RepID=UPI0013D1684C|nr:YkgJ family cysteine cluster protein [Desulfovibrio sp. JC010]NDV25763.1 YkgJ family cysteine cluster protein [Desulfovibrio sp. JC010]